MHNCYKTIFESSQVLVVTKILWPTSTSRMLFPSPYLSCSVLRPGNNPLVLKSILKKGRWISNRLQLYHLSAPSSRLPTPPQHTYTPFIQRVPCFTIRQRVLSSFSPINSALFIHPEEESHTHTSILLQPLLCLATLHIPKAPTRSW